MYTITFLLCIPGIGCQQQAPQVTFATEMACEQFAAATYENVREQVESGQMPDHQSTHQCVSWGTPA